MMMIVTFFFSFLSLCPLLKLRDQGRKKKKLPLSPLIFFVCFFLGSPLFLLLLPQHSKSKSRETHKIYQKKKFFFSYINSNIEKNSNLFLFLFFTSFCPIYLFFLSFLFLYSLLLVIVALEKRNYTF